MNDKEYKKRKFIKKLYDQKNNEYSLIGSYVNLSTKTAFKHNVCGYTWETKPTTLLNSKDKVHGGCPKCQYDQKRTSKNEFQQKLDHKFHGEYILDGSPEFCGSNKKTGFIHTKCGTHFVMTAYSIFVNNTSCPKCFLKSVTGRLRVSKDIFIKRLYKKYGDEYTLMEQLPYTGLLDYVYIKHNKCGYIWKVRANHILRDSGCPLCCQSKGEMLVDDFLSKSNYTYKRQFKIKGCKYKKLLPFDFAIFDSNKNLLGLIEYDGIQHFFKFKHFGGNSGFKVRKKRDKIKTDFCRNNKIPLLRLKYTLSDEDAIRNLKNFLQKLGSKAETPILKIGSKI